MIQDLRDNLLDLGIKPSQVFMWGFVGSALILSIPAIGEHQAKIKARRIAIQTKENKAEILDRQLEFEQRQARVANERYKSCLPVVGTEFKNGTHYFTGLKQGSKPSDRISGKVLPQGTVVCDAHGVTGVVDGDGTVQHIAYTGDRDVIQKRLKRFKSSLYSQPIIDNAIRNSN